MNIAICGINGAMGQVLVQEIKTYENINLVGSISPSKGNFAQDIIEKVDVIIDFSHPDNLDYLIEYAEKINSALLVCTTGFTEEQKSKITSAGDNIPVLLCSNTSLGINVFRKILKSVCNELSDFDICIIDKHHKKKKDAPSGTAKTMAEDIKKVTGRTNIETMSLRAGTIPGEHTVIFSGVDEILEIKHTALSKRIFAKGALELALKLSTKSAGSYQVEEFF